MFTGLIEEIGNIVSLHVDSNTGQTILTISARICLQGIALGDSIAVDGVCLTVTAFSLSQQTFVVGLSPETLRRTTFSSLHIGSHVNLERSLTLNSHIGGHYVQGHVDGVGILTEKTVDGDAMRVVISAPQSVLRYVVEKGYIAIDGISLTVVAVKDAANSNTASNSTQQQQQGTFEVMLIQYTQSKVTLTHKQVGQGVNLEADIMGKQIVAYLDKYTAQLKSRL